MSDTEPFSRASEIPSISVVVPIYDVEPYLQACLDSIAAQSFGDLEVICIDDGATDASGDIAESMAGADPRFRVVHQRNAGLGAARNAGAALARGEFLAFVDSDDLLPPDAYALLHASLVASGSDFAVGDIRRLTSLGVRTSPTFSPIYSPSRRATHVTRDHALLRDRIAPNKLYRRRFWTEHQLRFPVGVLYEDIAVTIPAHALATTVDVVDAPVYLWRIRSGADRSITQRRLEPQAIRDRITAVTTASRFLADRGLEAERLTYDRIVLTDDLRLFAEQLDRADRPYIELFLDQARAFLAQAHPRVLDDVPAIERLRWTLIRDGSPDEVVEIARFVRTDAGERPAIRRRGGVVEGDLPFRRGRRPRLPRELFRYDRELVLETRVTGYEVDHDRIAIDGWAHLRHTEVPEPDAGRMRMWLVRAGDGHRIELDVHRRRCPEATSGAVPDLYDLTGAGFRACVATTELTRRWDRGVDRWNVEVEVRAGRTVRTGWLSGPAAGAPRRPPAVDIGKLRLGPRVDDDVVSVVVAARPITVIGAEALDGAIRLELASRRELTHLRLRRPGAEPQLIGLRSVAPDRFEALIAAAELLGVPQAVVTHHGTGDGRDHGPVDHAYTVHGIDADGKAGRLLADDHLDQPVAAVGTLELVLDITRYGYTAVALRPASLWLQQAEVGRTSPTGPRPAAGAAFRLRGRFTGGKPQDLRVELAPRGRIDPRPLPSTATAPDELEIEVPVVSRPAGEPPGVAPPAPLAAGDWRLGARLVTGEGNGREVRVRTRRHLVGDLPMTFGSGRKTFRLDDRSWHQTAVVAGDDLDVDERGRFNQRRLWEAAAHGRRRLDEAVVIAGGGGRIAGGCPRAVYDELRRRDPTLQVFWAVRDQQAVPPVGAIPLRVGGREWQEALARSMAIVSDVPLPRTYERAPRQRCIRLWDGVPVRPVGLDAPGVVGAEPPAHAGRAWSHLVSPGPEASEILRAAFGFHGEVLAVGLARHDVLADRGRSALRAADVRDRLGIPADAPLVLYLPTWVDGDRHPGGGLRLTGDVDPSALRSAAGPDAWVLARAHPAVGDAVVAAAADPRVADVSRFPEVVDLMLAADVIVSHPSSVALEAVRCGTPVVVHDPAGAGLAAQLGEPYRDLVGASVPWPVTHTRDELEAAVRSLLVEETGAPRRGPSAPGEAPTTVHGEVTTGRASVAVADVALGG